MKIFLKEDLFRAIKVFLIAILVFYLLFIPLYQHFNIKRCFDRKKEVSTNISEALNIARICEMLYTVQKY